MSPYDERRATLDPGLTALVLRARRTGPGRYPFLEGAGKTPGRWLVAAVAAVVTWGRGRRRRAGLGPTGPRPPAA